MYTTIQVNFQRLEKGDYVARFTEKLVNYNTGNYKLIVGISEVIVSEVVKEQDDAIVNNKSGLITKCWLNLNKNHA
jgi:hypothetical protein